MGDGNWWGRDQIAKVSNLLRGAVSRISALTRRYDSHGFEKIGELQQFNVQLLRLRGREEQVVGLETFASVSQRPRRAGNKKCSTSQTKLIRMLQRNSLEVQALSKRLAVF
jgi:hypothetical protein